METILLRPNYYTILTLANYYQLTYYIIQFSDFKIIINNLIEDELYIMN